jgi:hypothetical protein
VCFANVFYLRQICKKNRPAAAEAAEFFFIFLNCSQGIAEAIIIKRTNVKVGS